MPVINALSDRSHPCQLVADVMTYEEHRGPIAGRTVAWLGDGNNMAATWVQTAAHCGFSLRLACPAAYPPAARDRGLGEGVAAPTSKSAPTWPAR